MNDPILETACTIQYSLGENYPIATTFFIAERLRYYDCWDINLELNYGSIEDLCGDGDWHNYCQQLYEANWLYDATWLEEYMAEWGTLPICVVECNANGLITNYTLNKDAPIGTVKYSVTQCMDDNLLLVACHSAGLINILY